MQVVKQKDDPKHPFGGCNKLQSQYRSIGYGLCQYERLAGGYRSRSEQAYRCFRETVAFVPIEVLESYLEDLLDLRVEEEKLNINQSRRERRLNFIPAIGIVSGLTLGLYAASAGASLVISFITTVLIALPFGFIWHLSPRTNLARRMSFAKIVSREVSRRRGQDDDGSSRITVIEELFASTKNKGTLPGAAKLQLD